MQKEDLDIILCHWPLLGIIVWAMTKPEDAFLELTLSGAVLAAVLTIGHLSALIYGIARARQQKWPTSTFAGWIFCIIIFSNVSLPWLYWRHLRNELPHHPHA